MWNIQRSQALERALTKILYPQLEKELRLKLVAEAKEGITKVTGQLFLAHSIRKYQRGLHGIKINFSPMGKIDFHQLNMWLYCRKMPLKK